MENQGALTLGAWIKQVQQFEAGALPGLAIGAAVFFAASALTWLLRRPRA